MTCRSSRATLPRLRNTWGSGVLLPDNDPMVAAEMINRIVTDEKLRETIIRNQRIRLKDF